MLRFILSLALLTGVAGAIPIANEYSGAVYINSASAPQGTLVTASVDGVMLPYSSTLNQDGKYSLQATGEVGQAVKFYINGNIANQIDLISKNENDTFDPYIKKNLNLSIVVSQISNGGSSGGGGGGGGGAPSDEDFKNIDKQESRDVDIHKGTIIYRFTIQDDVKEIGFDAKTSEGLATAKIEVLKGRPKKATSDAPGIVYRYFNVVVGTSGYGSSSKLENAYIVFEVPDDWLNNNNANSVKLMKFKDNTWIDLKTEKISTGTYKAFTPGFSGFAIVGVPAKSEITPIITKSTTVPQVTEKYAVPEGTRRPMAYQVFTIGLLAVIAIALVAYLKRNDLFKK